MRVIRHPMVKHDLLSLVDHIVETTQCDFAAAARRLNEIEAHLEEIAANPAPGMRLSPPLDGWLVRHGGRGYRITIVIKPNLDLDALYIALVAFGGQDWIAEGNARKAFSASS